MEKTSELAMGLATDSDEDRSYALAQRARTIAKNAPLLLGTGSLGAALVGVLLSQHLLAAKLVGWWTLITLTSIEGVISAYLVRHNAISNESWITYLRHYEFGAAVAGLFWGFGVGYFFFEVDRPEQVALIAVLFLAASATLSGNNASFRSVATFLVTLIAPTLLAALLFDAVFYQTLAAGLVLLLAVFLRLAYLADRTLMANAMLLSRVERLARTLAATNERLTIADAAKTRFLAAASHDLRQPMHAIGLLIGALRQQVTTPEAQENVRRIVAAVDGLTGLFDAILDISKLDAGVVRARPEVIPIRRILDPIRDQFLIRAQQKKLELKIVDSSVLVRSDPALLSQICQNLVANALRYTETGRILVGVRRRPGKAEVQVWDTGIGIPPAFTKKIFEEFVQLSNPAHDRSKGLGLGLSIVQRLADILGHRISVRSKVAAGSCFSVEVPTGMARYLAKEPPLASNTVDAEALRGAFVILVEDEEDVLHGMDALLREYGCHTVCATSGEAAIEALNQHDRQPDLIVSDFRLGPSETGNRVIERIRQEQDLEIPAIIVTGSQSSDDLKAAMSSGITVLAKPLNERLFVKAVSEVLGASAQV